MSVKDLASDMLDAMVGQPEIDAVQAASHGEVLANLGQMQGLEVMAKVAGDASPQATLPVKVIDLVDGNVEVVVPVIKTIQMAMNLASVYKFQGTSEFGGRLNNKQKRGVVNSYRRGLEVGFMEQPLPYFRNWFSSLRFADAILNPIDGKKHVWHFRNILLMASSQENLSFGTSPKKFFTAARRFYESVFHASPSMNHQIDRAMKHDITLMIAGVRVPEKTVIPKQFADYSSSLITLSAVSFQMFRDPNDNGRISVFLSLLGVTHHATVHPPSIQSWRRNGIGLFMLIQVIKRCASISEIEKIEVFLQCSEPSALHFYTMIGFRQINKGQRHDGYGSLPEHVRLGLEAQSESAFLRFPTSESLVEESQARTPILMHLRPGGLKHVSSAKAISNKTTEEQSESKVLAPRTMPYWCQYPPPLLKGGGRLVYDQKDADGLLASLPLLRQLLPLPFEQLLPAGALTLKGKMTLKRREEHTKSDGTKWISTGELDLMLSILLCDGRYEDAAFILPTKSGHALQLGFEALKMLKAMLQLKADNASLDETDLEKLIKKTLLLDSNTIKKNQQMNQNYVLENIIDRNPGLLSKKVLVFPHNEGKEHWSVTFVFNAGSIRENLEVENESKEPSLQPCFFRYCSSIPDGSRIVNLDSGVLWFLNLCYSNEVLEQNLPDANSAPMKWLSPYGDSFNGKMLGTKRFPSLRVEKIGGLPKQIDGFNCGVGMIAGIAIILRNVCVENPGQVAFDQQFVQPIEKRLQLDLTHREWFARFDENFFKPLPTKEELVWGDYLAMLREEWFVVFDRMAALHFKVLPQRLNKDNMVNPLFIATQEKTIAWPDPESMKKRRSMPKAKLAELVKKRDEASKNNNAGRQLTASDIIPVTQSPTTKNATINLVSPKKEVTIASRQETSTDSPIDLSTPEKKPMARTLKSTTQKPMDGLLVSNVLSKETDSETHTLLQRDSNVEPIDDGTLDHDLEDTPNRDVNDNARRDDMEQRDGDSMANCDLDDTPMKDANNDERVVDGMELVAYGTLDGKNYTVSKINDPTLLNPVKVNVKGTPVKRKGGDLLKRLHLDDILFEDNEDDASTKKKQKGGLKTADEEQEHGDYTVMTEDAKKMKISTQSTQTIEAFYQKYHAIPSGEEEIVTVDKDFKVHLTQFIAESLEKWNWSSDKDHHKTIANWAKKMQAKDCSESKKEWIRELIKGMKEERAQVTRRLTNEFMFTRATMVKGIRFSKDNNSFYARLVYNEPDKDDPKKNVLAEEELKVEEEWVRSEYAELDIQHIINMHQTNHWTDVPRDVEVRIAKHKVMRVRYVPPQVRHVLDYDAMAKVIKEKDVTIPLRRKRLGFPELTPERLEMLTLMEQKIPRRGPFKTQTSLTPSKVARKVSDEKKARQERLEKEEIKWEKNCIRKPVTLNEKWIGRMDNNQETTLEEDFVSMAFGEAFVKELKLSGDLRGFVDVPVGDFKPSHLIEHPNLKRFGAPRVQFNQTDGKDLCVSKSLASALFAIGFEKEAVAIDSFGEEILKGAVVDALENVVKHARAVLPRWILIQRLPQQFEWKEELDSRHLLLGVLSASDGSCCHAVTIHGGYVYDANEVIALPLCEEALNYCTSTALVKSEFVRFRRGYIFRYEGQRKEKLAKMTLQV